MSNLNMGTNAPSGRLITGPEIRDLYAKACITHPRSMTPMQYLELLISRM